MRRAFLRHWKTFVILTALGILCFQLLLLLTSEATTAAIVETERINGNDQLNFVMFVMAFGHYMVKIKEKKW